jgi:hypothetical protein
MKSAFALNDNSRAISINLYFRTKDLKPAPMSQAKTTALIAGVGAIIVGAGYAAYNIAACSSNDSPASERPRLAPVAKPLSL